MTFIQTRKKTHFPRFTGRERHERSIARPLISGPRGGMSTGPRDYLRLLLRTITARRSAFYCDVMTNHLASLSGHDVGRKWSFFAGIWSSNVTSSSLFVDRNKSIMEKRWNWGLCNSDCTIHWTTWEQTSDNLRRWIFAWFLLPLDFVLVLADREAGY